MLEIERKYLVNCLDFVAQAKSIKRIKQGFLNTHPERTVRVRISGEQGYLTIKGISNQSGMSRMEWEREISLQDAELLLKICEPGVIDKTRYEVMYKNYLFEVDVFRGSNEGLIIAEIELSSENEVFEKPEWLATEVTGDKKYYNSQLSKFPFKLWKNHY